MQAGEPLSDGHLLDGRYRIRKVIGAGGMGRVYLANDTRLANRPVAAKEMMVGDGAHEQKAMEDFAREARVLAMLSHPGIPNIIDYFIENGRHYLVMEFVAGGDLQHILDKFGPGGKMPEASVLTWSRQILEVLEFLHSQEPPIVYRDLKPGNIMIDKDGRAMLVDFGIARFLPPGGRGTQIGSVGYAPPEQYLGKMEPRSDVYSLGATMHHLLTGRDPQLAPPFSFPTVHELAPDVSAQTDAVVMRALDKDLNKRFASARDMRLALPDPGPEHVLLPSGTLPGVPKSAPAGSGSALGTMATMVLSETVHPPSGSNRRLGGPPSLAQIPTQVNLAAPAQMPTRVMPQAIPVAPMAPAKIQSPSSTAKTQDLKANRPVQLPAAKTATPSAPTPPWPSRAAALSARGTAAPAPRQSAVPSYSTAASGPARPTARLISRLEGSQFRLEGGRIVIGRSVESDDRPDIDLATLKRATQRVSRRHAEIIRKNGAYFIRDLGSLNGTYIGGRGRLGRDQLYQLKDRDELVLGDARFEFRES
jgi:serine/threonine protein kinase